MHLLWLKIYTPAVASLPAKGSSRALSRQDREHFDNSHSDEAFETMIAAEACLDDYGDAQHVAPWATMSVRRLLGESLEKSAQKSVPGALRSGHSGTTSSWEAS